MSTKELTLEDLKKDFEAFKTESNKKVAQLTEMVDSLQAENTALQEQLKTAAEPEEKPKTAKMPSEEKNKFTVGKKMYKFLSPIIRLSNWNNKAGITEMTAEDALTDSAVQQFLVEKKSGKIEEITE